MARPNAAVFVLSWGAGSLLLHLSTALSTAGSAVVAAIFALAASLAATPRALNSAFTRTAGAVRSTQTSPASRDLPSSPRARTAGPHAVSPALPERRQRRSPRDREEGDSSSLPEETP